jgi:hypothetical protein
VQLLHFLQDRKSTETEKSLWLKGRGMISGILEYVASVQKRRFLQLAASRGELHPSADGAIG